jgi:DNA recombination protein RmuC
VSHGLSALANAPNSFSARTVRARVVCRDVPAVDWEFQGLTRMILVAWVVAGIAALAIIAALVRSASRRSEEQLSAVRQEMQNSLASQSQSMSAQMNHLVQTMTQQLGQVRHEVQSGVASTGQLATDAQREVADRLRSSTEALVQMSQKIGEMHQTSQDLSKTTSTLQSILSGTRTRGALGETMLDGLLADALPQSAYTMQHRFASTGAIVDAIVRSGERVLCIDSKFPLEAYRRFVEEGEDARRDFSVAVRKHVDSIAEKYILPDEHTFDYALMYVPSEGVYYELLMTEVAKYGKLEEYCRAKRVFPVSPNAFCAFLSAIAMSLQGQKIEENARHLLAGLAGVKKQMETFGEVYERLGTHLRHAQQSYEDADSKLNRAQNSLEQMSQGGSPESTPRALEVSSGE